MYYYFHYKIRANVFGYLVTFTRNRTLVAKPVLTKKSAKHRSENNSNPALSKTKSIIISELVGLAVESKEGFVRLDDAEDDPEFCRTND